MTNPIRKTIIFLKKKLNIKEESYLDGASGSSYPINISKPTPGSVLHHEAPQEVLDTLKLMMTEAEARNSKNTQVATNVLEFLNVSKKTYMYVLSPIKRKFLYIYFFWQFLPRLYYS